MAGESNTSKTTEIKQVFLASAISDISGYIQMLDTKISIIMAVVAAFLALVASCYKPIFERFLSIEPCSWIGVTMIISIITSSVCLILFFVFGLLTIRGHSSKIGYKSKWFLPQTVKEYSFDAYKKDVTAMTDSDIIENMAAELYKLNDINRQKSQSCKWSLLFFSIMLVGVAVICLLFLIYVL